MNYQAVLLDIEGTTTPIRFVFDTLFPYARQHGADFLRQHLADEEIQEALHQLREENKVDVLQGAPSVDEEGAAGYYYWLMDRDRKSTPLKTIQGRIWQEGFAQGELQSEIFADVPPALERWRGQGQRVAIYSSGSVLAQQQVFRYSNAGDLTVWIDAYFDTRVGAKKESDSYRRIAGNLRFPPKDLLFVSDSIAELDAAQSAGLRTALSIRPGNVPVPGEPGHRVIFSFEELFE